MPMESSNGMPSRRVTSCNCGCVLMPAPRPVSFSALRSNTVASQPMLRSMLAANSPPTDPPIISALLIERPGCSLGSIWSSLHLSAPDLHLLGPVALASPHLLLDRLPQPNDRRAQLAVGIFHVSARRTPDHQIVSLTSS